MARQRSRTPPSEPARQGHRITGVDPTLDPLEGLVGLLLVGQFRWTEAVKLRFGPVLHGYAHRWTGACILIAADGRCFTSRWIGHAEEPHFEYVRVNRFAALIGLFDWGAGEGRRPWSDARTDRIIQDTLGTAMEGKSYLVGADPGDRPRAWDEPDEYDRAA